MAFPRRFSCDGAARPSATPSWCKRGYGRNERVARLGKAESIKPDLADKKFHEESLPDKLPAHLEEDIHRNPELCELEKEVHTCTQSGGRDKALSKAKQRYAT